MYKIQETTVSERKDGMARLEIQISNHEDVENSDQYVVLSVLIDCDDAAYRLEWLQSKALTRAADLIEQAAGKCETALSKSK